MTHADRVRSHPEWPAYCKAVGRMNDESETEHTRNASDLMAQAIGDRIASEMQLTQAQRYDLPHLARRRPTMGRPRKPRPRHRVCCPHCSRQFEVEVD